ncbi:hypothetical protein NUW54_g5719 [Trametes sanguinea]|uniref:Uncharacterized protein n=1 Tax=Trametes sanguinea TaxID=158606 RepID=A0ACC1PVZ5_9APHY|nr:hypothetical protein NUW54_g5719 [Trametes sanguinea]
MTRENGRDFELEEILQSVRERLKGSDASLYLAARALRLNPRVRFLKPSLGENCYQGNTSCLKASAFSEVPWDECEPNVKLQVRDQRSARVDDNDNRADIAGSSHDYDGSTNARGDAEAFSATGTNSGLKTEEANSGAAERAT